MRKFFCKNCNNLELGGGAETKAHLSTVHGVTEFKGSKRGVQFLDGSTWYENRFEWIIPVAGKETVMLLEVDHGQRSKSDLLYHEDK